MVLVLRTESKAHGETTVGWIYTGSNNWIPKKIIFIPFELPESIFVIVGLPAECNSLVNSARSV